MTEQRFTETGEPGRAESGSPGEAGPREVTWGPALVGVGVLVAIVLVGITGTLIALVAPETDVAATVVAQAALGASLIATPFVIAAATGRRIGLAALGLRAPRRSPLWGLAAYGAYIGFAVLYASLITTPDQEDVTRGLGADEGTIGLIVAGVLIVAVAPLAEEVFFRGFMFGGFRSAMGFWPAAWVSGAIFGLIHAPTGPAAIPPLIVLGVVLAWAYEHTGSIWPAVGVHAINNAFAFALLTS